MKIAKKEKGTPEIPQASLSDISFVLLAFFLSTTTFDIKKGVGLVLPPPSDDADTKNVKIKDDNLTKIKINNQGQIMIDKDIVPLNDIVPVIEKSVFDNPDMVFSLKVDRRAKYEYMVKVLDRLRLAGAEKISLSTN